MRAPFAAGLATFTVLATSVASADEPKAAPAYGELPTVTIPAIPGKVPGWIGGHEKTPGFYVRGMDGAGDASAAEVYASSADAKALREQSSPELSGCFREPRPGIDPQNGPLWGAGEPRIALWQNGVGAQLVRAERLVESADSTKATLETTDAWVDARTRGAKLVARASLPLVRVGSALDAVRVYAAREETPNGKRVHVVVTRKHVVAPSSFSGFMVEQHGSHQQGSCAHEHVVLRGDSADGDVAVVRTTVELPNHEPEGETPKAEDLVEMRLRELEVQLGASQTSRDPQPVFAVSFGWASREQRARVPGVFMGMPRSKMRKR